MAELCHVCDLFRVALFGEASPSIVLSQNFEFRSCVS